jgi:VanZ family protein
MGLIFTLSNLPATAGDVTEQVFGVFNFVVRKSAHLTEFAILAVLWYGAITVRLSPWRTGIARAAWLLSALYGLSDEVHQSFVPNRSSNWSDVALDSAGALIGLLLLRHRTGHL